MISLEVPSVNERVVILASTTVSLRGGAFIQSASSLHSITIDIGEVGRYQSLLSHSIVIWLWADSGHKTCTHCVLLCLGCGYGVQVHGARAAVNVEAAAIIDG